MRSKKYAVIIILVLMGVLTITAQVLAQGIKERMKARLPVIAELKMQGIVGETNRGYLGFVTEQKSHEDLIAKENQDRKTIYTHIAAQQNTQLAVVEKNRAFQLAQRAAPDTYLQKPDGTWVKK
jgi:uncharacterized protein